MSPDITDFLHQCFRKDAKLRPDAKNLLMHPWIQNSRRALQSLQRTGGRIGNIPQDVSTVVERTIEDGEKEEGRPSAENMTTELFEPGFEETTTVQSAAKDISANRRSTEEIDRKGLPSTSKLTNTNSSITEDDSDRVSVQDATLAISENLLIGSDSVVTRSVSEEVSHVAEPLNTLALSNDKNAKERVLCREKSSPKSRNVEVNEGVMSSKELSFTSHSHKNGEVNGINVSSHEHGHGQKAGKSSGTPSTQELSRFSDTPADGTLDDLFDEPLERHHDTSVLKAEKSTSVSTSPMNQDKNLSEYGKNDLAAKLKAKIAQKQTDSKPDRSRLFSVMMNVVKDDGIGIDGIGFEEKVPGRDIFPVQAVEVSRLIGMLKPDKSEDMIVSACQKLIAIFQDFPDQKMLFVSQHGLVPLMEMLEVANNRVIVSVLQIVNQLIKDNAPFQENACHIGLHLTTREKSVCRLHILCSNCARQVR